MLTKKLNKSALSICLFVVCSQTIAADNLFTLKNLERERAALIADILDTQSSAEQRQNKLKLKQRQLVDMERMVLRDERLLASPSRLVKQAFDDYDLTFLVHAGAEKNRSATEQWLEQVNVTNLSIMTSKAGYR